MPSIGTFFLGITSYYIIITRKSTSAKKQLLYEERCTLAEDYDTILLSLRYEGEIMTDIQQLHGNDDFYAIQKTGDWSKLSRIDRHIYFLSTGRNSCTDIAFLLKADRSFVRNRLCLLRIQNYVLIKKNTEEFIHVDALKSSFELIQNFRIMFVQQFYTLMFHEFPDLQNYVTSNRLTMPHLESEFFTFVQFLIQIAQQNDPNATKTLDSIVKGYRLCKINEKQLERVIYCFLKAFSHCLNTQWDTITEESWRRTCIIVEYAVLALCQ